MGINQKIINQLVLKTNGDADMKSLLTELINYESLGKGWWKEDYRKTVMKYVEEANNED